MRPLPPLLLARPTRCAALRRGAARAVLLLLGLALLLAVALAPAESPRAAPGDAAFAQALGAAVADGQGYYVAALDLTAGPADPLALPVPALPIIAAHLPGWLLLTLLALLAIAVLAVWAHRLQPLLKSTPHLIATALLAAGLAAFVEPWLPAAAATWGGLLLLLALGWWRPGRWVEPAALGLAAALVAPGAMLFLALMAAAALRDDQRREATGWVAALTLAALAFALHLAAVARLAPFVAWPDAGLAGLGPPLAALAGATPLLALPPWLAAPMVVLALAGWLALADPRAARVAGTLALYLLALAVAAPPDAVAWALLPAPLLLAGLVFVPDALRDLLHAAISRPRITVTRRVS